MVIHAVNTVGGMLHSVDGVIDWYLISQVIRSSSDTVYLLAPVVVIFNKA